MRRNDWMWVVIAGAVGLAAGWGVQLWLGEDAATAQRGSGAAERRAESAEAAGAEKPRVIGEPRPGFSLPTPEGTERAIGDFDGQVVLLNFWATWCPPCVEEMPALAALQDELGDRGLQVLGVALDDREPVREFARVHEVDYPLLVGSRDAYEIARRYGNPRGTLPYTVVIDSEGIVRSTHQGALSREEARALVEPHLAASGGS
jgi:peroxiredoxin